MTNHMSLAQLQTFFQAFGNPHHTARTVIVCPNGETFQFGSSDTHEPLMLYIKNLDMLPMCSGNILDGLESSYLKGYWDCNSIPRLLALSTQAKNNSKQQHKALQKYHQSPLSTEKVKHFPGDAQRLETMHLEFKAAWLDPSLSESIASFKTDKKDPLYIAQQRRLQSILKILQHRHALSILETHACWGTFTEKACVHHDITLTTHSHQHAEFCKNRLQNIPFPVNYQITTKAIKRNRRFG